MTVRLEDPVELGGVPLRNRLYRAPLLEVAGNRPDAAEVLERELMPGAESGLGLVQQGACLVTAEGGRTAPGLSRFHDRDFVLGLRPAVEAVHGTGAKLFVQLGHGALQCMELWHAQYRAEHPGLETLAVDDPPWWFRVLLATRFLRADHLRVMTEEDLAELAAAFGEAARHAHDAGYAGIHLAGANGSIFHQLWSPVFNRRTDGFGGGTIEDRSRFLRLVVEEIRSRTRRDYPITAKIPVEQVAPWFVRRRLQLEDGVEIARVCRDAELDAVTPVMVGVTRDQSVARGRYPHIAWSDPRFTQHYPSVFGSRLKAWLVKAANRLAAGMVRYEDGWNERFCSAVRTEVGGDADFLVMMEGGIRSRDQIDRLLGEGVADLVGMARPLYAEPRLPARLLRNGAGVGPGTSDVRALCENCNNCTIPQTAGLPGVCRTPAVLARRGELDRTGAYERRPERPNP